MLHGVTRHNARVDLTKRTPCPTSVRGVIRRLAAPDPLKCERWLLMPPVATFRTPAPGALPCVPPPM